jgi:hypothetical protein
MIKYWEVFVALVFSLWIVRSFFCWFVVTAEHFPRDELLPSSPQPSINELQKQM